jgi:hypothetical protein
MEAIYSKTGAVVAWLWERERVYDLNGAVTGRAYETSDEDTRTIYNGTGTHVGWLRDGLFRDHDGAVVAFLSGAVGGPAKPARQARPARPSRQPTPPRPARQARRPRAARRSSWSRHSFEEFMLGG